jgi:hypothetical protein
LWAIRVKWGAFQIRVIRRHVSGYTRLYCPAARRQAVAVLVIAKDLQLI